jgi:hypothetical protein
MGIFDRIKSAIFGGDKPATAREAAGYAPAQSRPAPVQPGTPPVAKAPAATQPVAMSRHELESILEAKAAGKPSNWRESIVDLMKLVGLDSSLEERRELARELGYTGSVDDTATMNVWLHKEVMAKLAANRGAAPASLQN